MILVIYKKMYYYYTTPGVFPPKVDPNTRKNRGHSIVMIMLNVCQHMKKIDDSPIYDKVIDDSIKKITTLFVKEDEKALFECAQAVQKKTVLTLLIWNAPICKSFILLYQPFCLRSSHYEYSN